MSKEKDKQDYQERKNSGQCVVCGRPAKQKKERGILYQMPSSCRVERKSGP